MTLVLTLPEQVEKQLYHQATIRELSPETVALELLQKAVAEDDNDFPSPEETVEKIKALPPNPHALRPAQGSLADALSDAPIDPDFDLNEWNQEWRAIEAELQTITCMNAIAEAH